MSLKKDNRDLKKHALCMSVFMKDITVDTQLWVLSVSFVSEQILILFQTSIKKIMTDEVYKDKETLKFVIT